MVKKKKQIHCRCGSPADWYKKGRNHRVLICSRCGMIANNPAPLIGMALSALAPTLLEKGGDLIGVGGGKNKDAQGVIITDSKDRPNYGERVINQVMKSEGL